MTTVLPQATSSRTGGRPTPAPVCEFLVPPSDYARPQTQAVRARGTTVTFADGTEALCATSGLWNVNLGYGNERIAAAIGQAALDASYLSLFRYGHVYATEAATALLAAARPHRYARVAYSTAGGAALDTAIKIVRQVALARRSPRQLVVSLRGSYHGLTFGAMGLTGEDLHQAALGVDQRLVRQISAENADEFRRLVRGHGHRIAGVVLEPVLGSGTKVVPPELIDAVLRGREEHGYLVVADEVATGFGRTGPMFASHDWSAQPDVLVTSKGLTNGTCAASAILMAPDVAAAFDEADLMLLHGETQAGTPVSCAAISATLSEFERIDALTRGQATGRRLAARLEQLADDEPTVTGLSGRGCFRSVRLAHRDGSPLSADDVRRLVATVRREGVVVHPGPSCIQLIPALTYDPAALDEAVDRVARVLRRGDALWA